MLGTTAPGCEPVLVKPGATPEAATAESGMCAESARRAADEWIRTEQLLARGYQAQGYKVDWYSSYHMYRLRLYKACLKEHGWVER